MDPENRGVLRAFLVAALVLALPATAAAQQEPDDGIPPCEGDVVAGTVVAVDETGVVTVRTDAGFCTVALEGQYEHPVYGLIGSYFGDASVPELGEALDAIQLWVIQDGPGEWEWSEEENGTPATVLSAVEGQGGVYSVELAVEGEIEPVTLTTEDAEWAETVLAALEALEVEWRLQVDDEGDVNVAGIAEDIGTYHEDGVGLGVLVKVYAIAAEPTCADGEEECAATVEELIAAIESGAGIGELFEQYGKPSVVGVGHIREEGPSEAVHQVQEAFLAEMEACRADFHEARESLQERRKALQEQIRELRRSDAEGTEEQRARLQAELEGLEGQMEALEAAYEECLGDADLTRDEAMSGLNLDGDEDADEDGDGGPGNGKDKKPKKDKDHGPPDHAKGWGPGGNPEELDED
jgi:hypothetical protein